MSAKTLDELAIQYGTDKSSKHHNYCVIYEKYLEDWRHKKFSMLECGVGGYEYPDRGGQSHRMWKEYFQSAEVHSFDLYPKNLGLGNVWKCSQTDAPALCNLIQQIGPISLFIDDGSHHNEFTIKTFEIVFPLLESGGIYIVEDVETAYWAENFAGKEDITDRNYPTTINYFTYLVHSLNHEYIQPQYELKFKNEIEFIHFYRTVIIIKKK